VRPDGDAGVVGSTVVHQPHSQSQRREIACDVCWHDLPAPSVEAPVPLAEHGMCSRGELNARVALATEPLVELMQRHRDEVSKGRVLQLRQLTMRQLVLYVQTMVQAVLGQTAIANNVPVSTARCSCESTTVDRS